MTTYSGDDIYFSYSYDYGNGDYYTGYGYADSSFGYYTGQVIETSNETGYYSYYYINYVDNYGYDYGLSEGQSDLYINSYYDGGWDYDSVGTPTYYYADEVYSYGGDLGLGSEYGEAYDWWNGSTGDNYFDSYYSADLGSGDGVEFDYQYYTFTYHYGNGDTYSGYGYAPADTYTEGQLPDFYENSSGESGYYEILSVAPASWYSNQVSVNSYYDQETGTSFDEYSAWGYGYGLLGTESGSVYQDYGYNSYNYNFDNSLEIDLNEDYSADGQYYTFTYYYGNGDSYSGDGYTFANTYTENQELPGFANDTGELGYYEITWVESSPYYGDYVYVTSYDDFDTGYGVASAWGSGTTLGTESGTASGTLTDTFSNAEEADLLDTVFASDLASAILGSGVEISNAIYRGSIQATGIFNEEEGLFGSNPFSGLVLSTGNVVDIYGPNDSDSTSTDFGTTGDADLNALVSPSATQDASVLEFDFKPSSNFLSFEYVFASEEYNEWVGSSFNDVFGFFLTDEAGNQVNIALIPGTTTPIAINNVNKATNSAYYRDNDLSDTTPLYNTEFDGLTTVLTAVANVDPAQTYHFKLAIADNSDGIYDSAVFINGGTFGATPLVAVNTAVNTFTGSPTVIDVLGQAWSSEEENPTIANFDPNSEQGGEVELDDNGTPDDLSDDQFVYTPPENYTGSDSFNYQVTDSNGNTSQGTVFIDVQGTSPDTPSLSLAALNANQTEGNSGIKAFTFEVKRSGDTSQVNAVNWSVWGTGDNPANPVDFNGNGAFPSGLLTFDVGETLKVVTVDVRGDLDIELDETFTVSLFNPTNGAILDGETAIGTIQNDDSIGVQLQIITSDTNLQAIPATPDGTLTIPLYYNTSTGDNTLTGIGLRLHYNSSELTFDSTANLLSSGLFGEVEDLEDTLNYDFDTNTDRYLVLQYADFNGSWPNETLPLKLADFNFTASESFENTSLNITSDNLAAGYQLQADTLLVSQDSSSQWNLDIDGNGVVDALTDGIMAVRYMFYRTNGSFADDALTNGAIALDATRNLEGIQSYLQEGFDNLSLDIDGNGVVDSLTDGIMAVRYMFNQTNGSFAGDALTDGAIAPNATRDLDAILAHLAEIYI